jgi:outer membrane protein assembly factor BamB
MTALVLIDSQVLVAAENWPQWRGPQGTGVAADGDYPVKFSSESGIAWKAPLPGVGSSTPAVWGDNIFVTCAIDGHDGIICFDMKGQERWRKQFGEERRGKHRNGTGSNPSPVTDGQHVVAYYKTGDLVCLDLGGNEKWRTNLQERFGKDTLWWDLGTSPVLAAGSAIVAVMHSGDSYLAAFDLASGDLKWKEKRQYECAEESDHSYSTPQVVKADGKDVIVTWGADHLTGHDAVSGQLLWEADGFNPENEANWRTIASHAVSDGVAIVPYGRGAFTAGIKLNGEKKGAEPQRLWKKESRDWGSDVPTPVTKDGKAYMLGDRGRVTCLDLATGDELWSSELPKNRNKFYASPVLAGDKLYCAREDGIVFVGQIDDRGFELVAENDLQDHLIATPVPIRGGLLVRCDDHLFRIGKGDSVASVEAGE